LLHEAQDLDAVGIIAAAFIGHRDTPGGPAEQRHADSLLELSQMPRDRRLTDSELARDRRKVPALGHANEGAHALKCDVRSIHFSAQCYALPTRSASALHRLSEGLFPAKGPLTMKVL